MRTPLFDAIHRLSANGGRFHVPGHKGSPAALPFIGKAARYDFTEVPGADDLQHPAGPIAASEENMARLYGSAATLYSASGSTSCIEAMLTLFVPAGGRVVMARNCHLSAVRALAFLGATPAWVQPRQGRPAADDIAAALSQAPAHAVYITSPDYYGRIADIEAIAAVCRAHGVPLLVDNAHGAHLKFLQPDLHPLHRGADACCDSAHKTLPCLTPAALLHLKDASLQPAARRALNLYSSTSPGYLVLQSLDYAAGLLAEAPPDFAGTAARLAAAAAQNPAILQRGDDPLKLCLYPAAAGCAYTTALEALTAAGLTPELADGARIVLMASPYNTEQDFTALSAVLAALPCTPTPVPREPSLPPPQPPACGIREAVFATQEALPVAQAVGRVAAEVAAPCPPGSPVVVPGERVGENEARLLADGGISTLSVVK